MGTHSFDRPEFYRQLHDIDSRLSDAINDRLARQGVDDKGAPSWRPDYGMRVSNVGARARNVQRALEESEPLALRALQATLGNIGLETVWSLLRSLCHDVALYLGSGAIAGALIGGFVGAAGFGVGAIPGSVTGAVIGTKAGAFLLNLTGLKSVIEDLTDALPKVLRAYQDGFIGAWGRMPDLSWPSFNGPHAGMDQEIPGTHQAARDFARGHELLVLALLTGIVAYITRGRGQLPALLAEIRSSTRLGPKFATWIEQNADKLSHHPLLQERSNSGSKGIAGGTTAASTASNPAQIASPTAPAIDALKRTALRSHHQLLGRSEGGPGKWVLSPPRAKGVEYQEQITGVERGMEYAVPQSDGSGKIVLFDGYDAERKVLLDAKDWKNYPPSDYDFWESDVLGQASAQRKAGNGSVIEWHFRSREARDAVYSLFQRERVPGIILVTTPD